MNLKPNICYFYAENISKYINKTDISFVLSVATITYCLYNVHYRTQILIYL